MNEENPYHVLGIKPDATAAQIKAAYRKQARLNHPDVHHRKSPEEQNAYAQQFRRATWAHDILSDAEQRAYFDKHGYTKDQRAERPKSKVEIALLAAFRNALGTVTNYRQADMVDAMRAELEAELNNVRRELAKVQKIVQELDTLQGRFRRMGDVENVIEQDIAESLVVMKAKETECEEKVAHLCECIGELGHWSYRADKPPQDDLVGWADKMYPASPFRFVTS
ncbi:MAG: molecular chaperone DnaJ [Rariglobus sp.]|jgi:DnaJ-class molecular chaperone|nr:molecular chaperone DnaJ [Rariglobus sp.]